MLIPAVIDLVWHWCIWVPTPPWLHLRCAINEGFPGWWCGHVRRTYQVSPQLWRSPLVIPWRCLVTTSNKCSTVSSTIKKLIWGIIFLSTSLGMAPVITVQSILSNLTMTQNLVLLKLCAPLTMTLQMPKDVTYPISVTESSTLSSQKYLTLKGIIITDCYYASSFPRTPDTEMRSIHYTTCSDVTNMLRWCAQ